MRIAGTVSLGVAVVALVFMALGTVGAVGASGGGYTCLAVFVVLFGGAGWALLAGSRVMPRDWPPEPPDHDSGNGDGPNS